MKKLLLFGLILSSFLMAKRYPIIFEYNYMVGCMNGAKGIKEDIKKDYCVCSLKAMEDKYTASEVIEKLSDPKDKKTLINYLVKKCVYIINK